jgi:hypothetical protein
MWDDPMWRGRWGALMWGDQRWGVLSADSMCGLGVGRRDGGDQCERTEARRGDAVVAS